MISQGSAQTPWELETLHLLQGLWTGLGIRNPPIWFWMTVRRKTSLQFLQTTEGQFTQMRGPWEMCTHVRSHPLEIPLLKAEL